MAGKKGRSGRPPGSHDISPLVRAQFLRAIEIHKQRTGKSFAEVLADLLERDLLGTLNTVTKFNVKESRLMLAAVSHLRFAGYPQLTELLQSLSPKESLSLCRMLARTALYCLLR
jgi:hypothetical protein